ncbi:hypothetical protein BX616_002402 [Lobosporangium transversale]|nr:hypothetical protein BX616_002402 [Lobosporangium transversale]
MELCNWSISSGDFVQLLCSCPSLKKLTLDAINGLEQAGDGEMHEQDGNNDLSNFLRNRSCNTASSFTHIGLDELTFIGRVVPRILPLVPNITHLIFKSLLNGDFHGLQHQINLSQCLTHITSLSMPTECVDPSEFMCLIRKIPRDQLAWFEGKVPVTLAQEFLRTIIQRQSQTIETLVILNGEDDRLYIGSRSSEEGDEEPFIVWKLFECSPQLITVVIPYNLQPVFSTFNTNDGEQPTLNVLQQQIYYLPAREWVCSELKRLYLRLKDMDRRHPMDQITFNLCVERLLPPDERRVDDNTKRSKTKTPLENMIMERLSSLHKLQSLNIGNGWFPLPKAYK